MFTPYAVFSQLGGKIEAMTANTRERAKIHGVKRSTLWEFDHVAKQQYLRALTPMRMRAAPQPSPSGPLDLCPCGRRDRRGSVLPYPQCCGRYLDHFAQTPAPDAESLMRSRYTAFVRERADYLLATWHSSHRPDRVDFESGIKWLGLEVRAHVATDAGHAEVEFVARQRDRSGAATRLAERSRFVREQGEGGLLRWYYLDGVMR